MPPYNNARPTAFVLLTRQAPKEPLSDAIPNRTAGSTDGFCMPPWPPKTEAQSYSKGRAANDDLEVSGRSPPNVRQCLTRQGKPNPQGNKV